VAALGRYKKQHRLTLLAPTLKPKYLQLIFLRFWQTVRSGSSWTLQETTQAGLIGPQPKTKILAARISRKCRKKKGKTKTRKLIKRKEGYDERNVGTCTLKNEKKDKQRNNQKTCKAEEISTYFPHLLG
jgi:hypothetical protein